MAPTAWAPMSRREVVMLTNAEREIFASRVIDEVRRWPGVELRPHASATVPGEQDGVEFRLFGRQMGHVHQDCALHLSLTRALKETVVGENLAEHLEQAGSAGWAKLEPISAEDAERAIWLLRLNYVRLRRQRLTPNAAANSALLQEHESALGDLMSSRTADVLKRTQARTRPRPLPSVEPWPPREQPPAS